MIRIYKNYYLYNLFGICINIFNPTFTYTHYTTQESQSQCQHLFAPKNMWGNSVFKATIFSICFYTIPFYINH